MYDNVNFYSYNKRNFYKQAIKKFKGFLKLKYVLLIIYVVKIRYTYMSFLLFH